LALLLEVKRRQQVWAILKISYDSIPDHIYEDRVFDSSGIFYTVRWIPPESIDFIGRYVVSSVDIRREISEKRHRMPIRREHKGPSKQELDAQRKSLSTIPHVEPFIRKYAIRTKRGSVIVIGTLEDSVIAEIPNHIDALVFTGVLDKSGISFKQQRGISKMTWRQAPKHLREPEQLWSIDITHRKNIAYPGLRIITDKEYLDKVVKLAKSMSKIK